MDEPKAKQKTGMAGRRCLSVILCVALACASAMARDLLVKGRVMSGDEPLAGATVQQKDNLSNGTMTDADGNYSITVPDNSSITVTYIGYEPQTEAVKAAKRWILTLRK